MIRQSRLIADIVLLDDYLSIYEQAWGVPMTVTFLHVSASENVSEFNERELCRKNPEPPGIRSDWR